MGKRVARWEGAAGGCEASQRAQRRAFASLYTTSHDKLWAARRRAHATVCVGGASVNALCCGQLFHVTRDRENADVQWGLQRGQQAFEVARHELGRKVIYGAVLDRRVPIVVVVGVVGEELLEVDAVPREAQSVELVVGRFRLDHDVSVRIPKVRRLHAW